MAGTIEKGITITFRGDTAQFDDSVSKINGELKSLKSETKLLNRELKLDPNNFDKLSQKLKNLKQQESLLKEELDAYNQAMSKMDKNSDAFKEAETKARNLKIELGYVQKSIEKMGGNQLSLGLKTLGKELEDAGNKVTKLGQKFTALSTAAAGVIGALGKLAYDTVTYADDINTLSKQTGLSTDTLQAFGQMADLIDVDLQTLSKSAVYLTKNLDNKTAIESYKKLGVEIKDVNGKYRNTEDILFDTLTALQKVEDETERSMLASDLFGKSYSNLGSILNDTGVDLSKITDMVKENGIILSQDDLNALNDANDDIDTLKMTLKGVGTSLIADFKEPIKQVTSSILILAQKVKTFVNSLSNEQKTAILKVLAVIATIAPVLTIIGTLISGIGTFLTTVGTILQFIIPIVTGFFTILATNPIALVVTAIGGLIAVLVVVVKNFDDIKEKVMAVWEQFKQTEFIQTIIGWFEYLRDVVNEVVEAVRNVYDWITKVISKAGELLSSGIQKVAGWFSSGGFGNAGAFASGGYGTLELQTTINVNNNGSNISSLQAQQFGRQIVEYVNDKLGRRI